MLSSQIASALLAHNATADDVEHAVRTVTGLESSAVRTTVPGGYQWDASFSEGASPPHMTLDPLADLEFGLRGSDVRLSRNLTAESEGLGGVLGVSFRDSEFVWVPWNATDAEFRAALESLSTVGRVSVERVGTELTVTFDPLTNSAGDLPEISLNVSMLSGLNANATVRTLRDGSHDVLVRTISAEYLRVPAEIPDPAAATVQLMVRGIAASCSSAGHCAFARKSSLTPVLDSIALAYGNAGDRVTVTGAGFRPGATTVHVLF